MSPDCFAEDGYHEPNDEQQDGKVQQHDWCLPYPELTFPHAKSILGDLFIAAFVRRSVEVVEPGVFFPQEKTDLAKTILIAAETVETNALLRCNGDRRQRE